MYILSIAVLWIVARWHVLSLWVNARRRLVRVSGRKSGIPQGISGRTPRETAANPCPPAAPALAVGLQTTDGRAAGSKPTVGRAREGETPSR